MYTLTQRPLAFRTAAIGLAVAVSLFGFVFNASAARAATLTTDKADYAPGETATIYGSLFDALQSVVLSITGQNTDGSVATAQTINVQADNLGDFTQQYTLPDTFIPLYLVAANSTDGTVLAQTTFTDASLNTVTFSHLGASCGTDNLSVNAGTSVCAVTTGTSSSGGGVSATYNVRWLDSSNAAAFTDADTANGSPNDNSHVLNTAGTWTVQTCKNASCTGTNLIASKTISVQSVFQNQTITFGALGSKTYGDVDFGVSATANSGLTVTFSSQTTGVCTVSGSTVHIVTAGTCTVRASQAGDPTYNAALNVDQSFTVAKATPTLSVTNSPQTYNGSGQSATVAGSVPGTPSNILTGGAATQTNAATYTVTANFVPTDTVDYNSLTGASAGNFVIGQASSVTVINCPASEVYNGSAQTPCSATVTGAGGLSLTPTPTYANNTTVGSASASYSYTGDTNHTSSSDSKNFSITQASSVTTVVCSPTSVTYNGSAQTPCTASVAGAGGLNQSLTVNYTNNTNAGTAGASATFGGDTNHSGSTNSTTFIINPATAVCTINGYTGIYNALPHGATGSCAGVGTDTSPSGLDLGDSFTDVPGGTADWSFTNSNYVSQNDIIHITITRATPKIIWANPADIVYGTALSGTQLDATANTPGDFTYASAAGIILNAGNDQNLHVDFVPTDTTNYTNASADVSISVLKADQTITVDTAAPGGAVFNSTFPVAAHSDSGLTVDVTTTGVCSVLAGTVTMTSGTGICTVHYNQGGNGNYNAATEITSNTTATKADQVIIFGALSGKTYGNADFPVSATSDSGLSVTFGASGNCTVNGNTVHITGAGSCTIAASQTGDDNYKAATDVPQSFNIAKATLNVIADNQVILVGSTLPTFTSHYSGFVNGEATDTAGVILQAPSCAAVPLYTPSTPGGVYPINCTGGTPGNNYTFNPVSGSLVVIGTAPPVSLSLKDFKNGSTIPVKIPSPISGWNITLQVCLASAPSTCQDAASSGSSNAGSAFRFDSTGQQYIFNLSTKNTSGFNLGQKYNLMISSNGNPFNGTFNLGTITISSK